MTQASLAAAAESNHFVQRNMRINISFNFFKPGGWVKLPESNAMAPRQFTATFERDPEGDRYVLDVELDSDGRSRCTRIEVDSVDRVPRSIEVARLLRLATASAAGTGTCAGPLKGGGWRMDAASNAEADEVWEQQVRRVPARRRDAPGLERMKKAAEAWIASGGNIIEVAHECQVSQATAYRYLALARHRASDLGFDPAELS